MSTNPKLYQQLKELQTEQRNKDSVAIDLSSPLEIARIINEADSAIPQVVSKELHAIAQAIEVVSGCFRKGGRLFYVGAGTSGRLGILDAAECPPTFGTNPEMVQGIMAGGKEAVFKAKEGVEDSEQAGREALENISINKNDVVCGLAASGRTPFVIGALKYASKTGCPSILVTTVPKEQIRIATDILISVVTGPEVITGSTRMKSATAQKMVLNMISTGAMIRLGKVYENIMVDLQLTNEKLKYRALRIISEIAGVDTDKAAEFLKTSGGNVKKAIVMAKLEVSSEKAEELLEGSQGFLRKIFSLYEK